MSRRSMPIPALLLTMTVLVVTGSRLLVGAQLTNSKQVAATAARASRPGVDSLCPLLAIGIGLFAAATVGLIGASSLERVSRSAMHIARASRVTLLAGLAVLLIYSLSVSYWVLFR
jgi:hypothetical protein